MTLLKKVSLLLTVIVAIIVCVWLFNNAHQDPVEPLIDQALTETIVKCEDITERAASHLVAIVEFQKLEIAGRKARVFKMCMNDHGYVENTQWLKYSEPLAKKTAQATNISVNEALENARRAQMVQSTGEGERPTYWVKKPTNKS